MVRRESLRGRRQFLKMLAASPLLRYVGLPPLLGLGPGADAVAIGRPYAWGLASFGQDGVEKVLDILHFELMLIMKQMGTRSIEEIRRGGWVVDRRTGKRL